LQFSENNSYREYFVERFGVPAEIIEKYHFYEHGRNIWAYTGKFIKTNNVECVGVRALRVKKNIKPTTAFLRVIGNHCTKNVVELTNEQRTVFMRGQKIEGTFSAEPGYVVVKHGEDILGCGLLTRTGLESQIPGKYREEESWV